MTKKEEVKLGRWEWIKRYRSVWLGDDKRLPRKIRRAFSCVNEYYHDIGMYVIFFPTILEDGFVLTPGKRYRWIIEELDELPDGMVSPKK